ANIYHFMPLNGFSIDSRTIVAGNGFIALQGKHHDGHQYIAHAIAQGARFVIAQREFHSTQRVPYFLVEDSYRALAVLSRYAIKAKRPYVYAITGSVGKTTTKEMLAFLLEANGPVLKNYKTENNILGVAKTCFSLRDEKTVVLELGTNAPGEIRMLADIVVPDTGIITFIKPVHLEGLGSMRGIFEEKISLFDVNARMRAILNRDDAYLRKVTRRGAIRWFGKHKNSDLGARGVSCDTSSSTFLVQNEFKLTLRTPFGGFIYNALAAILSAHQAGMPLAQCVERLNDFSEFPSQRAQCTHDKGFFIFNDAYNANPYSFLEALRVVRRYPSKKIAVVGDMRELGSRSVAYHQALARHILRVGFESCFALGEHAPYLVEELKKHGYRNAFCCASHEEIAASINQRAHPGWLIFLKGSRATQLEKVLAHLDCKNKS
ncbi:MAG: UDP-N-acetylmuramoyl-tripeptide--D-alanyl-D-alanine ligase, partial [Candidatus Omnitrophica bacterium]|nr:UDP-N-acetylmuramoyl-tripeptide--D-alanyl-D-alanine ligase [Candidatus Omnitrophota bacterium]